MNDTNRAVHAHVQEHYGKVARGEACEPGCCGGAPCGSSNALG